MLPLFAFSNRKVSHCHGHPGSVCLWLCGAWEDTGRPQTALPVDPSRGETTTTAAAITESIFAYVHPPVISKYIRHPLKCDLQKRAGLSVRRRKLDLHIRQRRTRAVLTERDATLPCVPSWNTDSILHRFVFATSLAFSFGKAYCS